MRPISLLRSSVTTVAAVSILLLTGFSSSASAEGMVYQGRLTDNAGVPLSADSATLTFNLWKHQTNSAAADKLWGPFTITNVDLIGGRFNVVVGPLDASSPPRDIAAALAAPDTYIHITVAPEGGAINAALPRQRIYAAPKALSAVEAGHALTADTATNFASNVLFAREANGAPENAVNNGTERVGIGTTTPANRLSVSGNADFTGKVGIGTTTVSPNFTLQSKSNSGGAAWDGGAAFGGNSNAVVMGQLGGVAQLGGHNGALNVWANLSLNSGGGNVGIGTASPSQILHVQTPGGQTGRIQVGGTGASGVSKIISFGDGLFVTIGEAGEDDRMELRAREFNFINGNVGIGTSSPQVKLDVEGSRSITMYENAYNSNAFTQNGTNWTASGIYGGSPALGIERYGMAGSGGFSPQHTVNAPVAIRADGWIASASGILVFSDRRIKRDMQASATAKDLATIQQLQVTDYRMVDPADGGMAWQKGFIAQEVEKVIPGAITRSVEFVPDVFALATDTVFDPDAKTLTLTLPKDHGLAAGDRVRLHMDGKRVDLNVSAVPSAQQFVVAECPDKPEKVLVYGKQVDDFRTVNYDRVYTTTVGAVQELANKLEANATEIAALKQQLTDQAEKITAHGEQLAAITRLVEARAIPVSVSTISTAK